MAEKKQSKSERAQALMREQKRKERTRNLLVVGAVVVAIAIIAVVGFVVSNNNDSTGKAVGSSGTPQNLTGAYNVEIGKSTAPDTIKMYEDFQCPICKAYEAATGTQVQAAIAAGKVKVDYHMVAFLDRASTTNYSSRALNAGMAVLSTAGPDAFLKFHTIAYANQPDENSAGVPDSTLIQWAVQAGADEATVTPHDQRQRLPPVGGQRHRSDVEGRRERDAHRVHQRQEPGQQPAGGCRQRPGAREVVQVERVQRWVMSTLLLTVCALFATGMAILSGTVDRAGAQPGLLFISGVVGLMAMAGMRAINLKRILTPWLLLGLLPAVVVGVFYRVTG